MEVNSRWGGGIRVLTRRRFDLKMGSASDRAWGEAMAVCKNKAWDEMMAEWKDLNEATCGKVWGDKFSADNAVSDKTEGLAVKRASRICRMGLFGVGHGHRDKTQILDLVDLQEDLKKDSIEG